MFFSGTNLIRIHLLITAGIAYVIVVSSVTVLIDWRFVFLIPEGPVAVYIAIKCIQV